jgi:hypothetical protein
MIAYRSYSRALASGTYEKWYAQHVDNSVYRPLIDYALEQRKGERVR